MTGVYIAILIEVKAFNHVRLQAICWLLTDGTREMYFFEFEFLVSILSYTDPLHIFLGGTSTFQSDCKPYPFFHPTVDVRVLLPHLTFWYENGRSDGTFVPSLRYDV